MQTNDLDILKKDFFNTHEENKQELCELEDEDDVNNFEYYFRNKLNEHFYLLFYVERLNPHKNDKFFKNKIKEIKRDVNRKGQEMINLIIAKKKNLHKGLSPERVQQFLQFEADESHVEDQCQVCLEDFEVGRLMKQLDCGGRHSFCSVCIDQWFTNHKTCPICRPIFV